MPDFSHNYYMMLNPYPSGRIIARMPQYVPPPVASLPVVHHPDGSVSDPRIPFQVKPVSAFEPPVRPMAHIKRQPVATPEPMDQASLPFEAKPKQHFRKPHASGKAMTLSQREPMNPQQQPPMMQQQSAPSNRSTGPMLLPLPDDPLPAPPKPVQESASVMDVSMPPVPYLDESGVNHASTPSTAQPMLLPLPEDQ